MRKYVEPILEVTYCISDDCICTSMENNNVEWNEIWNGMIDGGSEQ